MVFMTCSSVPGPARSLSEQPRGEFPELGGGGMDSLQNHCERVIESCIGRKTVSLGDGERTMLNFLGCSAQGIAVANGATTLALLERLVERKILTCDDVRAILKSGIDCLEPRSNVRTIAE